MATLTKEMLSDLHKGNASISLLACPANGQVSFSTLDFSTADQIFTTKDSFTINDADPTITNIQIDQLNEIIDTDIEDGDYVINANIPSIATAVLDYFYNAGVTVASMLGQDGTTSYAGKGYLARKEVFVSILVESASKNTAICFARVKCVVNRPSRDDNSNPAYLKFAGYINANLKSNEGNFAVLKANAIAA